MALTSSLLALRTDDKLLLSRKPHSNLPRRRPAVTSSLSPASWVSVQADIHTHLLRHLPATARAAVSEPMRHFISAAPKTPAPALCLAACELAGGPRSHAMDAACALRLAHAAVAVHDGLPALLMHEQKPEPSPPFSDAVRILIYQGMSAMAYEIIARSARGDPVRGLRVVLEMAGATGARGGAVEGQYRVAAAGKDSGVEEAGLVEAACEKKEGRLSACGAACGAIMGGGGEEATVERLRRFGHHVGMMHGLLASGKGGKREAAAERFRALAGSEVDGFEKAGEARELVDWWYEEGRVAGGF